MDEDFSSPANFKKRNRESNESTATDSSFVTCNGEGGSPPPRLFKTSFFSVGSGSKPRLSSSSSSSNLNGIASGEKKKSKFNIFAANPYVASNSIKKAKKPEVSTAVENNDDDDEVIVVKMSSGLLLPPRLSVSTKDVPDTSNTKGGVKLDSADVKPRLNLSPVKSITSTSTQPQSSVVSGDKALVPNSNTGTNSSTSTSTNSTNSTNSSAAKPDYAKLLNAKVAELLSAATTATAAVTAPQVKQTTAVPVPTTATATVNSEANRPVFGVTSHINSTQTIGHSSRSISNTSSSGRHNNVNKEPSAGLVSAMPVVKPAAISIPTIAPVIINKVAPSVQAPGVTNSHVAALTNSNRAIPSASATAAHSVPQTSNQTVPPITAPSSASSTTTTPASGVTKAKAIPSWHSKEHSNVRRSTVQAIISLLMKRQTTSSNKRLSELPHLATQLENHLYNEALDYEAYKEPGTLKYRIQLYIAQHPQTTAVYSDILSPLGSDSPVVRAAAAMGSASLSSSASVSKSSSQKAQQNVPAPAPLFNMFESQQSVESKASSASRLGQSSLYGGTSSSHNSSSSSNLFAASTVHSPTRGNSQVASLSQQSMQSHATSQKVVVDLLEASPQPQTGPRVLSSSSSSASATSSSRPGHSNNTSSTTTSIKEKVVIVLISDSDGDEKDEEEEEDFLNLEPTVTRPPPLSTAARPYLAPPAEAPVVEAPAAVAAVATQQITASTQPPRDNSNTAGRSLSASTFDAAKAARVTTASKQPTKVTVKGEPLRSNPLKRKASSDVVGVDSKPAAKVATTKAKKKPKPDEAVESLYAKASAIAAQFTSSSTSAATTSFTKAVVAREGNTTKTAAKPSGETSTTSNAMASSTTDSSVLKKTAVEPSLKKSVPTTTTTATKTSSSHQRSSASRDQSASPTTSIHSRGSDFDDNYRPRESLSLSGSVTGSSRRNPSRHSLGADWHCSEDDVLISIQHVYNDPVFFHTVERLREVNNKRGSGVTRTTDTAKVRYEFLKKTGRHDNVFETERMQDIIASVRHEKELEESGGRSALGGSSKKQKISTASGTKGTKANGTTVIKLETKNSTAEKCMFYGCQDKSHVYKPHPYVPINFDGTHITLCTVCCDNWHEYRQRTVGRGELIFPENSKNEEICAICADGGVDLVECADSQCAKSYCIRCLKYVLSGSEFNAMEENDDWACMCCCSTSTTSSAAASAISHGDVIEQDNNKRSFSTSSSSALSQIATKKIVPKRSTAVTRKDSSSTSVTSTTAKKVSTSTTFTNTSKSTTVTCNTTSASGVTTWQPSKAHTSDEILCMFCLAPCQEDGYIQHPYVHKTLEDLPVNICTKPRVEVDEKTKKKTRIDSCYDTYKYNRELAEEQGIIRQPGFKNEDICAFCALPGDLIMCDDDGCSRSYCENCLWGLLATPDKEFYAIKRAKWWSCMCYTSYTCSKPATVRVVAKRSRPVGSKASSDTAGVASTAVSKGSAAGVSTGSNNNTKLPATAARIKVEPTTTTTKSSASTAATTKAKRQGTAKRTTSTSTVRSTTPLSQADTEDTGDTAASSDDDEEKEEEEFVPVTKNKRSKPVKATSSKVTTGGKSSIGTTAVKVEKADTKAVSVVATRDCVAVPVATIVPNALSHAMFNEERDALLSRLHVLKLLNENAHNRTVSHTISTSVASTSRFSSGGSVVPSTAKLTDDDIDSSDDCEAPEKYYPQWSKTQVIGQINYLKSVLFPKNMHALAAGRKHTHGGNKADDDDSGDGSNSNSDSDSDDDDELSPYDRQMLKCYDRDLDKETTIAHIVRSIPLQHLHLIRSTINTALESQDFCAYSALLSNVCAALSESHCGGDGGGKVPDNIVSEADMFGNIESVLALFQATAKYFNDQSSTITKSQPFPENHIYGLDGGEDEDSTDVNNTNSKQKTSWVVKKGRKSKTFNVAAKEDMKKNEFLITNSSMSKMITIVKKWSESVVKYISVDTLSADVVQSLLRIALSVKPGNEDDTRGFDDEHSQLFVMYVLAMAAQVDYRLQDNKDCDSAVVMSAAVKSALTGLNTGSVPGSSNSATTSTAGDSSKRKSSSVSAARVRKCNINTSTNTSSSSSSSSSDPFKSLTSAEELSNACTALSSISIALRNVYIGDVVERRYLSSLQSVVIDEITATLSTLSYDKTVTQTQVVSFGTIVQKVIAVLSEWQQQVTEGL